MFKRLSVLLMLCGVSALAGGQTQRWSHGIWQVKPGELAARSGAAGSVVNATMDADMIVRRMVTTYQSAQTVQEHAEAKMKPLDRPEYVQSTDIKFRRPNLLYLASDDPNLGTYSAYCNGKTVTMYTGRQNLYTKRISPTDLRKTVVVLAKTGNDLMHFPITQMLNPVSFLSAKGLPDECKHFRYVREEIVDGHSAYMVTGEAELSWLDELLPLNGAKFDRREIDLWIDTKRNLLLKASCDVRWHIPLPPKKGTISTLSSGVTYTEIHRDIKLNVPIRETAFFFVPPGGAIEKFQEHN